MTVTYDILRAHLIAEHGYTDEYFDHDYKIGGPITDLSNLRWLHAPWRYEKGHRDVDLLHIAPSADPSEALDLDGGGAAGG